MTHEGISYLFQGGWHGGQRRWPVQPVKCDGDNGKRTAGWVAAAPEISMDVRKIAGKQLSRVHIDIADPMPVASAGGREYMYIVMDDSTRAVYARPLRFKSEGGRSV